MLNDRVIDNSDTVTGFWRRVPTISCQATTICLSLARYEAHNTDIRRVVKQLLSLPVSSLLTSFLSYLQVNHQDGPSCKQGSSKG